MSSVDRMNVDCIGNLLLEVRSILSHDVTTKDVSCATIGLKSISDAGHNVYSLVRLFESDIKKTCQEVLREPLSGQSLMEESRMESIIYSISGIAYMSLDYDANHFLPAFFVPLVYSDDFVIHHIIPLVVPLLERSDDLSTKKGLFLLKHILSLVRPTSLSCQYLPKHFYDYLRVYPLHVSLVKVMRFCPEASLRQEASVLFKRLLSSFEKTDRRDMIDILINTPCQVPGVIELAVNEYRSLVIEDQAFLCKKHFSMTVKNLIVFCSIKETSMSSTNDEEHSKTENKEDSALLDKSEAILSLLNFVRFFSLRDPRDVNRTGIWDLKEMLTKDFVIPLKKRVEDKQSSLLLQLKSLKSEDEVTKQQRLDLVKNMQLQIQNNASKESDAKPDECPDDYEEQSIQMSLTRLSMILSVVDRVHDIFVTEVSPQ